MRINPILNTDGTQSLKGSKPFFAVGWIKGSSNVLKITSKEEYFSPSSYNIERGEMVQNRVVNAQVFNGDHILGFGWEILGMDLNNNKWEVVNQNAVDNSWDEFITEVKSEGLILPDE